MLWCTCQTLTYVIRATDAHAKSRHTAPVRAHSPGTTAPKSVGSGREQRATGCAAGRPRRSDFVLRGQARPEGAGRRSRAAGQRAADGKKFGFWAPWRREAASCCPSRNLGAATHGDRCCGWRACLRWSRLGVAFHEGHLQRYARYQGRRLQNRRATRASRRRARARAAAVGARMHAWW